MRALPLALALAVAATGHAGGASAQTTTAGAQVVQTAASVEERQAVEEQPPGGSRPNAAVWIALGVAIGLVILIAAINEGGVGFPDTDPGNLN